MDSLRIPEAVETADTPLVLAVSIRVVKPLRKCNTFTWPVSLSSFTLSWSIKVILLYPLTSGLHGSRAARVNNEVNALAS